jgi:hypothetical protein
MLVDLITSIQQREEEAEETAMREQKPPLHDKVAAA